MFADKDTFESTHGANHTGNSSSWSRRINASVGTKGSADVSPRDDNFLVPTKSTDYNSPYSRKRPSEFRTSITNPNVKMQRNPEHTSSPQFSRNSEYKIRRTSTRQDPKTKLWSTVHGTSKPGVNTSVSMPLVFRVGRHVFIVKRQLRLS